jgi:mannose-6-phosphate isomerase-like protein (cupin superfamily)
MTTKELTKTHLSTAEAERADFPGLQNRFLLRAKRTGGRFGLVEHTIAPRALAAPMHTHRNEDEYSYVLSGRIGAVVGEEEIEAGPGELLVKPRGVPHAFWSATDEETRVLETITPGGFEQYFADIAPILSAPGEPDFAALAAVQARYEMSMDPSSIGSLVERFGLRA